MKSIFDPDFKYRPSHDTDVSKTFDRIRREKVARALRTAARSAECEPWFDGSAFADLPRAEVRQLKKAKA